MAKQLGTWVRVGVSLALLGLLVWQVGAQSTLERLRQMSMPDFAIALVLYLIGVWLRAWRWQGLLAALGLRAGLARLTELYFVGTFFNQILPTGVGGDVVRAAELARDGSGGAMAASSVLVDRATGLITLMVMAVVTLAVGWVARPGLVAPGVALVIVLVSVGTMVGVAALISVEWLRRWLSRAAWLNRWLDKGGVRRFTQSFRAYGSKALTRALWLSMLFNLQLIAVNYYLGRGLGVNAVIEPPAVLYYLLFVPIISFVLMLPISISGLGAREAAYVALFGSVGVAADQAFALSLAFYAVNVLTGLVGGGLYVIGGFRGARTTSADVERAR